MLAHWELRPRCDAQVLPPLHLPLGEGGGEGTGLHDTAASTQSSNALTLTLPEGEGTIPCWPSGSRALAAMRRYFPLSISLWERAGVRAWAFMTLQLQVRAATPSPWPSPPGRGNKALLPSWEPRTRGDAQVLPSLHLPLPLGEGRGKGMGLHDDATSRWDSSATLDQMQRLISSPIAPRAALLQNPEGPHGERC